MGWMNKLQGKTNQAVKIIVATEDVKIVGKIDQQVVENAKEIFRKYGDANNTTLPVGYEIGFNASYDMEYEVIEGAEWVVAAEEMGYDLQILVLPEAPEKVAAPAQVVEIVEEIEEVVQVVEKPKKIRKTPTKKVATSTKKRKKINNIPDWFVNGPRKIVAKKCPDCTAQ